MDEARACATLVEDLGLNARTRVWVEVDPALDTIAIDPQRVEQVLRNLVENALKFSSQDAPVMIEARPGPNAVELAVVDRGAGIAPQDLPHIFERFHQAGEVLSREAEGAGLGLYITKRLVEAMGGTIDVSSTPGEGSTFRITLPLAGEAEAPPQGLGGAGTTEQAPTEAAPTAAAGT